MIRDMVLDPTRKPVGPRPPKEPDVSKTDTILIRVTVHRALGDETVTKPTLKMITDTVELAVQDCYADDAAVEVESVNATAEWTD